MFVGIINYLVLIKRSVKKNKCYCWTNTISRVSTPLFSILNFCYLDLNVNYLSIILILIIYMWCPQAKKDFRVPSPGPYALYNILKPILSIYHHSSCLTFMSPLLGSSDTRSLSVLPAIKLLVLNNKAVMKRITVAAQEAWEVALI